MPDPLISLLLAAGFALVAAGLLWPQRGLLDRWRAWRQRSSRIQREDALKHLHDCWMAGRSASLEGLAGAIGISVDNAVTVLNDLDGRGLIHHLGADVKLTSQGLQSARHIVRAHRLLERYLAETTGYEATDWHQQAEWMEHELTAREADLLSAELGHPTHDPHGDPIPTAEGEVVGHRGYPLTEAPLEALLQIVHLEDQPESVYAQLIAEDLHVGQKLRLISKDAHRIRFWAQDEEHVLAPIVANNVTVEQLPATEKPALEGVHLSDLDPGERGRVLGISPACRGPDRRRLLDLGVLPGTEVSVDLISPGGDPKAYRIRGALIALRDEQADRILVDPNGAAKDS